MESEDVNKMSRRNKLLDSQFKMIEVTGKISGDVKDILYLENKDERLKRNQSLKGILKELVLEIYNMSDSLNIDFREIIEGIEYDIKWIWEKHKR